MIASNMPLTLLVIIVTLLMTFTTNRIGGASAKYFVKQQETLGAVTGYIEEMINGQKVIKVFCHEEKAKQGFDNKNRKLYEDSALAYKMSLKD